MFNKIKNFHKDIGGNFAIIFGLSLTPLMLSAGLAVDYSRMSNLENKMIVSSDAALLAAMKKLDEVRTEDTTYDETITILEDEFEPFFEANLLSNNVTTYKSYNIEFIQIDNEAIGTVTVEYDPVIMNAFGHKKFDLETEIKVNLKYIPENFVFDIVMCVDSTNSMTPTLEAAVENAKVFDTNLRTELGIPQDSNTAKIRIRPIFFRDYQMQDDWEDLYEDAMEAATDGSGGGTTSGQSPAELAGYNRVQLQNEFNSSSFKKKHGKWRFGGNQYKGVVYSGDTNGWAPQLPAEKYVSPYSGNTYYFFENSNAGRVAFGLALDEWFEQPVVEDEDDDDDESTISANEALDKKVHIAGEIDGENDDWDMVSDTEVDYAESMKGYFDFIDLNPGADEVPSGGSLTDLKLARTAELTAFLESENATAPSNYDHDEAVGACLDFGMRSDWWEEVSQESRDFFDIPADTAINDPDAMKSEKVTTVPIMVFWTDNGFQSLSNTQQISPTQPTTFSAFKAQWENPDIIPQDNKILMLFGPADDNDGWNNSPQGVEYAVKNWDGFVHGGSLTDGNANAIDMIADEILKLVPEVLRISG